MFMQNPKVKVYIFFLLNFQFHPKRAKRVTFSFESFFKVIFRFALPEKSRFISPFKKLERFISFNFLILFFTAQSRVQKIGLMRYTVSHVRKLEREGRKREREGE